MNAAGLRPLPPTTRDAIYARTHRRGRLRGLLDLLTPLFFAASAFAFLYAYAYFMEVIRDG